MGTGNTRAPGWHRHGYQSDAVPRVTQALGTRRLYSHQGGTAIRATEARQAPGLGHLVHLCAGPFPAAACPHPCPPRHLGTRGGCGAGAGSQAPGSPRGIGQRGGSVCGDTCAGGGDMCAGRGGAEASPQADGHSLMKRWLWPCQLSPSPWTNGCLTCLWGHKAERVSSPRGGGPRGARDPAPATLPLPPSAIPTATPNTPPPGVGAPTAAPEPGC